MQTFDCVVVGGGIVGLSVASAYLERYRGARVMVLEKETTLARRQSGRNSGVIHSGIYYPPGSLKARMCRDGSKSMVDFCVQHGVAHEVCGKLIVATEPSEMEGLRAIYVRGLRNQIPVRWVEGDAVREVEPHVNALAANLMKHGHDVLGVDTGFYRSGWLYNGVDRTARTQGGLAAKRWRGNVETISPT